MLLLLLLSARAVRAMACAKHSLEGYFFQKGFFGELMVFRHLNMDFPFSFNVILGDFSKISLSSKTKT